MNNYLSLFALPIAIVLCFFGGWLVDSLKKREDKWKNEIWQPNETDLSANNDTSILA